MDNNIIIGIDLGTTNTVAACIRPEDNTPVILTKRIEGLNRQLLPSVVYFEDGKPIVGLQAKNRLSQASTSGIAQVKLEQMLPFEKRRTLRINETIYQPEDVQRLILEQAMKDANDTLRDMRIIGDNDTVSDVIITIPAFFKEDARRQTENAAHKAGLNLRGLIHEPAAAALCYFSSNEIDSKETTMLVLDLGGGTFDICLLSKQGQTIDVLAQEGGPQLGGYFWDRELLICALMQAGINDESYLDDNIMDRYLHSDKGYASIINAERCREQLTQSESAPMTVMWGDMTYNVSVTRTMFNNCCLELLDRLILHINDVCQSTGHLVNNGHHKQFVKIDKILLVGGATQMPIIEQTLYDYYEAQRSMIITRNDFRNRFSPDTCVAIGAAIYGKNIGYYNFCWEKALNTTNNKTLVDDEPDIRYNQTVDEPDLILKVPTNYTYGIDVKAIFDGKDGIGICNVIMKGEKLSTIKRCNQQFTTIRDGGLNIKIYESQSSCLLDRFNNNIHTQCGIISFGQDSDFPRGSSVNISVGMDPKGRVSIVAECNGIRKQITIN